jgi:molybdate transport system substrate-binding protein
MALPRRARAADAAAAPPPIELTVYAAASLRDALGEIATICEGPTGSRLLFNFGASNDLARQIVAAHKADIFFSADESWMEHVAGAGLVDAASRRALLSNRLVVVAPSDSTLAVAGAADLARASIRRLALANPDAVPAGRYAKAWLEKSGVWEKVRDRVVPGTDVRATLATVEAGAVEAGIVYRTDAAITSRVRVVYVVPEEEGPRIVYPVAAMGDRPHLDTARRVVDCFSGQKAREQFERLGFVTIARAGGP